MFWLFWLNRKKKERLVAMASSKTFLIGEKLLLKTLRIDIVRLPIPNRFGPNEH
jgi:hypothetical protein